MDEKFSSLNSRDFPPLPTTADSSQDATTEEEDLLTRSAKKIKNVDSQFDGRSSLSRKYGVDFLKGDKKKSYLQTLEGGTNTEWNSIDSSDEEEVSDEDSESMDAEGGGEEDMDETASEGEQEGITIEEWEINSIPCPIFKLSKELEARINRPWKHTLIVKLLGRKIRYKAMEAKLKLLWIRTSSFQLIDIGHDFFLVKLSSKEDYERALVDGPRLIYDHYLTVRKWMPEFDVADAHIESIAAWIRIPELPIQFYDSQFLTKLVNRIGKTVKVDFQTVIQSRGKYARVCMEVDLTKPLLSQFFLKGKCRRIEYEGLHMLCFRYRKFGHSQDGCPDKPATQETTVGSKH